MVHDPSGRGRAVRHGATGPGCRAAVAIVAVALLAHGAPVAAQGTVPPPSARALGAGAAASTLASAPAEPIRGPVYTVDQLADLARIESPFVALTRAEALAARAGIDTARARPNPELEIGPGRLRSRATGADSGNAPAVSIAQPFEFAAFRESRIRAAESRAEVVDAQSLLTTANVVAEVRRRAVEVLRVREELQAFADDLALAEQIRDRVQVRVRSGEAPRFDLVRAEGEVAVARKNLETARLRLRQAMFEVKRFVGPRLEDEFDLRPDPRLTSRIAQTEYQLLRLSVAEGNPVVEVARRDIERADRETEFQRQSVMPRVTGFLVHERDPAATLNRVGVQVTVPIFDRREGPIAEAAAQAQRARLGLETQRHELLSAFDAAWSAYQAASAQTQALEGGIIERARTVLEIAEAAYRLGERGILEFLDAQRQFRLVRNELIAARYNLQLARVELERLAGRQP